MCNCSNTGVEWTLDKSQHTKLTLERTFSHRSCQDLNLQSFDHESDALPTNSPGTHFYDATAMLKGMSTESVPFHANTLPLVVALSSQVRTRGGRMSDESFPDCAF